MPEQDLCGGLGLDAEHGDGALRHHPDAVVIVGPECGGDGDPVRALRIGVEDERLFGVDEGSRVLASNQAKLAQLQQALELQEPDPFDLVLLSDDRGQVGERFATPPGRGGVEQ